jgi:uncharacterized protein YcgI (DUF1989 family)
MTERAIIPARTGKAVRVPRQWQITLINTRGAQVVDTWAFSLPDLRELMSMEHTRSCLEKLIPRVGDSLYTNRRRPILTILADTSPGVHDLLLSACDGERYRLLGHQGYHASCVENLEAALAALGLAPPEIPSPWNVFENVAVTADGRLEIQPPPAKAGDHVVLRAEMDAVVVFSACPMDIVPTNGLDRTPKEAEYRLSPP